ncbi:calcium-binding protein [Roseicyclus amphidinii]|uniref:calcium-binding protein n=1 Tax=Roseicyclus amphidinii TaxID=3034232 RepID=UPI0024E0BF53|nr:calcium-binding protein [Roseicyclus sp. Amp-Y-6]
MATFVLNGVTLAPDPVFQVVFEAATQLTIVFSDERLLTYEYSTEETNPGFLTLDLAEASIPEAFFPDNTQTIPPDVNSFGTLSPYGQDQGNATFFFEVTYRDAEDAEQTAVLLSIFVEGETPEQDRDHVFVLSSSDPDLAIPNTPAAFAAFFGSLESVAPVTSGPFAPGAPIDFDAIFGPTLDSFSDQDTWSGFDFGEYFDGGAGNDSLSGGGGADVIVGGAGNDTIDGGSSLDEDDREHVDAVAYVLEGGPNGVTVNLGTNSATDSFGNTDELTNIEAVAGTDFNDVLIGDDGNNIFAGGDGADLIDGGGGFDEVDYEFLGQDGIGVEVDLENGFAVDSWSNTDTLQNIEDVFGTPFDDTIIGDAGDNVLSGGVGDDEISGGAGNDFLIPSEGAGDLDTVDGGDGQDTLRFFDSYLNEDFFFVIAPNGDSTISNGIDTVIASNIEVLQLNDASFALELGTTGNDSLSGGSIGAVLLGLEGDDLLTGTENPDVLIGGAGNDTLIDNGGDDLIFGDEGDDLIIGTTGSDYYDGGDGFDTLRVDVSAFSPGLFTIEANLATGIFGQLGNPTNADELLDIEAIQIVGGLDAVITGDAADNLLEGGSGDDTISGGAGDDRIIHTGGDDSIDGGEGTDTLRFFSTLEDVGFIIDDFGNSTLSNGTDTITVTGVEVLELNDATLEQVRGTEDADTLNGGANGAVLLGLGGDDLLTGTAESDVLLGGLGNDTLIDTAGDDLLVGGDGDDRIVALTGNDAYIGGDGHDTLVVDVSSFAAGAFVYELDLSTNFAGAQGNPNGADEVYEIEALEFTGAIAANVIGDAADNFFSTGSGDDTISGGQGFDWIEGGAGDDVIRGNLNADTIYGGDGFDTLFGNFGNDLIYGGANADSIYGGDRDDELHGEAGTDFVVGQVGNDTIYGGDGFDTLRGGAGDDLLYGGAQFDLMQGGLDNDTLYGEGGADQMYGNVGNDLLDGGDGQDGLFGAAGADTLIGGAGDDRLFGGRDGDLIDGGTGNDTMFGGFDTDVFVFGLTHGADVIRDFDADGERIDVSAFALELADLTITAAGDGAVVTGVGAGVLVTSAQGSILLEGVVLGDIGADDFLFGAFD